MFSRIEKFLFGLILGLLFAGLTLVAVSADDTLPPQTGDKNDCASCHQEFEEIWRSGSHGGVEGFSAFQTAWNKQGKPAACLNCHVTGYDKAAGTWAANGVTCAACHTDTGGQHPQTPMGVNTSADACGTCHTDTRFGFEESTHYALGVDCAVCHDPHSTKIKFTVDLKTQAPQNESNLCINCHKDMGESFNHTLHSQKGVTCVNCHLTNAGDAGGVHQVPDHSFNASLKACNECHAGQMHKDGKAIAPIHLGSEPPASSHPSAGLNVPDLSSTPNPVSPLGYAGITALIGLAAGMLLAPWLERGYKLMLKRSEEVAHDSQ